MSLDLLPSGSDGAQQTGENLCDAKEADGWYDARLRGELRPLPDSFRANTSPLLRLRSASIQSSRLPVSSTFNLSFASFSYAISLPRVSAVASNVATRGEVELEESERDGSCR